MRNYFPGIGVRLASGSLLLLCGLHTASLADTLTVHVQNVNPYRVELQFHSETSGGVWPGNGQVWKLSVFGSNFTSVFGFANDSLYQTAPFAKAMP